VHGLCFHCLQCPNFDFCAKCFAIFGTSHVQGHNFQPRYQPITDLPMDGSDLDILQNVARNDGQSTRSDLLYFDGLKEQIKLLNENSRDSFIRSEIERASNWKILYSLYCRFESCVSILSENILSDGIPVPPESLQFQAMLKEKWGVGNAKEAAFFQHADGLKRRDYSDCADKKRLRNTLQTFVGQFLVSRGTDGLEDPLSSGFTSGDELPRTPTSTKVVLL
jgi:hypothetical protein